jgi:hypothetical protein
VKSTRLVKSGSVALTYPITVPAVAFSGTINNDFDTTGGSLISFTITVTIPVAFKP